ncbi:hypothetical protein [Rubrivirga sp. IMCC45206]|uniref:hypothetical protein n=1 Tax=Rubrivirga sp. IMCC45206 TaxID=3391614 RepID=UPI00398FF371
MIRLLSLLSALLALGACASSADTARDDDRIAQTLASIDTAVDLTDAQSQRVREILVAQEANRPSRPSRGGQGGQAGPPRGGDRDAQRAEVDRQIEAVLTDDQVAAFRTWRASQPTPQDRPPRGSR